MDKKTILKVLGSILAAIIVSGVGYLSYCSDSKNQSKQNAQIQKLISTGKQICIDIENDIPGVSARFERWEQACKGLNTSISKIIDDMEKTDPYTKTLTIIDLLETQ